MFGQGKQTHVDPATLSVFVHDVRNAETLMLAQKIWKTNERAVMRDDANGKEILRFVFSNPACVVWLQRDAGSSDETELVLLWDGEVGKQVTEVYVLSGPAPEARGDSTRAHQLLSAILSVPSTVPLKQ